VIELMTDMPAGTVGFRFSGEITRRDYDDVLRPELERAMSAGPGLRALYLVEDLDEMDAGALWADARLGLDLGLRRHKEWVRSAIVTDVQWIARAARMFAWMIPGEFRILAVSELDQAKEWVAEQ
jgi:hypothetical protein